MKSNMKCLVAAFLMITVFSNAVWSQFVTLDWKMQDIGAVRQWIPNNGGFWAMGVYDCPLLINVEYPVGNYIEHIGEGGIWVGAITPNGDTLVSVTNSWNPWREGEFWPPTNEPWDTIWVVNRNDTVDIPYFENYVGLSDRDYVFRYNDYNPYSLTKANHVPLYVDVIEIGHNWSAPEFLSKIKLYEHYVISREYDLKKVYISMWADPNVGLRSVDFQSMISDDYTRFFPELQMGVGLDAPGGVDGFADYPIGVKLFPPDNYPKEALNWTFIWGGSTNPPGITPSTDKGKYEQLMMSRKIMEDQQIPTGSHFIISCGPMELNKGDTLHFYVALVLGDGLDEVIRNAKTLEKLKDNNFKTPAPPPKPLLRAFTDIGRVRLVWSPTEEVNPENYFDPYRADGDSLPFEGYRLYKSTISATGPWKLLAEFDVPDDGVGNDIGLQYEYVDEGLLNNVEYYYSVTAFSKPDKVLNWPSLETTIEDNAITVVPGAAPPETVGKVAVVPNPYRGDIDYSSYNPPWEKPPATRNFWMEQDRRIQFINLPLRCKIRIYTASGKLVTTLDHDATNSGVGYHDWNLTSYVGQAVSSGIYLFTVEDLNTGKIQVGKFVIIK